MTPDAYINSLTVTDCHVPIKTDVAWLRLIYEELRDADRPFLDNDMDEYERISTARRKLQNVIAHIQDMIYKSVEAQDVAEEKTDLRV